MADGGGIRTTVVSTFWSKVFVAAAGAVTSVVLARTLGPDGRGAYAVAVTYASTAMVLGHLSVEHAHIGMWADRARRMAIVSSTPLLGALNGTVASILAVVLSPIILGGLYRPVAIALLGVIPLTIVLYVNSIWVLRGSMGRVNRARLLGALVQLGALSLLATFGSLTVEAVVAVWVGVAVLHAFVLLKGFGASRRHVDGRLVLSMELLGARYHFGTMATFLLWRIDILVLAALASEGQVGLYSLAVSAAELVYLVTDSISQVTLPRRIEGDLATAAEASAQVTRLTVVTALGAAMALVAAAPLGIPVVYGREFARSVWPLLILTPGIVALATAKSLTPLLLRCHRPGAVSAMNVVSLVANLALCFILIPQLGAVGAAAASTAAYVLLAVLSVILANRLAGLQPGALVPRWSEARQHARR